MWREGHLSLSHLLFCKSKQQGLHEHLLTFDNVISAKCHCVGERETDWAKGTGHLGKQVTEHTGVLNQAWVGSSWSGLPQ